jgi:signal transduction histidine kinase
MTFRDLPIRQKLLVMSLASSAAAVVLISGGFLVWDTIRFRDDLKQDVSAQAQLLAETTGPALQFDDPQAALETLMALRLRPRVEVACLYTNPGALFASYGRTPEAATCPATAPPASFGWRVLEVRTAVSTQGQRVGLLYIRRDLDDVAARLRVGFATVAGLLLVAILAAFLVASGMQRAIAAPLLQLADTARAVSTGRDVTRRAAPTSKDELGVVMHAFNDMLDRIDARTAELEREVEERRRVEAERTAALERERDANRLKDEFLATLSHELRNPLNAVLGWARLIESGKLDEEQARRAIQIILRNVDAQVRLVEDLLEMSSVVTGRMRLAVQTVDLRDLIEEVVDAVRPGAEAKGLRLHSLLESPGAAVSGDPDRLRQVVWNLLANAVKFTPRGGRVEITAQRVRSHAEVVVSDTGQGIHPDLLPYVFDRLRQGDSSTTRLHGGLGIGLSLVRHLVELHGGSVFAESPGEGHGATFVVKLPLTVADVREQPLARREPTSLGGLSLGGVRVLVVDDDPSAVDLVVEMLSQSGADATGCGSVGTALPMLVRWRPDVLVSDIEMPEEDGYTLIRKVRALSTDAGGKTPAVALTAFNRPEDRIRSLRAGFSIHVSKPVDPDELIAIIANLAGRTA